MHSKGASEFFKHEDLAMRIFSLCPLQGIITLSRVSRNFYLFSSADSLWRFHLKKDFNLDASEGHVPKSYYQLIKNKLAEEQEMALQYYVYRVLGQLEFDLGIVKNIIRTRPEDLEDYLEEEESLKLFSREQINYLASDSIFEYLSQETNKVDKENSVADNIAIICQSVKEMHEKIDNSILQYIKSLARPHFDALYNKASFPLGTTLPIHKRTLLDMLYDCNANTLLRVFIYHNPNEIDQLALSLGNEIFILYSCQRSLEKKLIEQEIRDGIEQINFFLSYNINVDKIIVWKGNNTTPRKMTQLYIDQLKLANYVFLQSQNNNKTRLRFECELKQIDRPQTLATLKEINVPLSSYFSDDIENLTDIGLHIGLNVSADDLHVLDIDPRIDLIFNKILSFPEKKQQSCEIKMQSC